MAKFKTDCEATITVTNTTTNKGKNTFKKVKAKRVKLIVDDDRFQHWSFFAYSAKDNNIALPNHRNNVVVIEGCSGQAIGYGNTITAAKSDAEMNLNRFGFEKCQELVANVMEKYDIKDPLNQKGNP